MRRTALLVGWITLLACCACQPGPEPYEADFHLVNRLQELQPRDPDKPPSDVPWLEIGFDRRRALLQPAPSVYRLDAAPSGEEAYLSVAPTMTPAAWRTGTDGVGFEIRCQAPDGEWIDLLRLRIDPGRNPEDRTWHPQKLSLAPCSAPTTSLELQTTCGPAEDCRWDRAAWGDPRIVHQKRAELGLRRLVLLISIDTLRPDRMSLYGARRPTTPEIDRLAQDGIVFETAVAPAPWTIPSHASLLTSTDPEVHGATSQHDIHPELPLVSEVLREAGWTTAGFVDTPWLGRFGFDRGYDHYDALSPPNGSSRRGVGVTRERLLQWLDQAAGDVFVFWHIMDVHGPYGAPAPFGGRFRRDPEVRPEVSADAAETSDRRLEQLRKLAYHDYLALGRYRSLDDLKAGYDEGIAHVDAEIGRLLEFLRKAGLYDESLVIVTSDHGESFMDHGVWVGHGLFLTEDEIRIPLVVKLPGNEHAGTRVEELVRLTDVAPTLLDGVGVSPPPTFEGLSLIRPRPGVPGSLPRVAFGTSSNTGARYVRDNELKLITPWGIPRDRVISNHLRPKEPSALVERVVSDGELFDLASDPEEQENLFRAEAFREPEEELQALLQRRTDWLHKLRQRLEISRGEEAELTEEEIRRLQALGYLGGNER